MSVQRIGVNPWVSYENRHSDILFQLDYGGTAERYEAVGNEEVVGRYGVGIFSRDAKAQRKRSPMNHVEVRKGNDRGYGNK